MALHARTRGGVVVADVDLNPHDGIPLNPFKLDFDTTPAHQVNLLAIETDLPQSLWGDYERAVASIESQDRRREYDRNLAQRLLLHARVNAKHGLNHEFDPAIQIVQYEQELDDAYEWPVEEAQVEAVNSVDNELPRQMSLDLKKRQPKPFPYHILPDVLVELIHSQSIAKSGHPDISAVASIAVISTIANQLGLTVHDGLDWESRMNVFILIAADRGDGKSPVFKRMIKPLESLAEDKAKDHRRDASHDRSHLRRLNEKLKRAEILASSPTAGEQEITLENEARFEMEEFERTMASGEFRMHIGGDTTPEAFLTQLRHNRGILSILDDEGAFFTKMTKYSDVVDISGYLKSWDGGTVSSNRQGAGYKQVKDSNAVFMLMVQPHIVKETLRQPAIVEAGLADRFLIAAPKSEVGTRDFVKRREADLSAGPRYDAYITELWHRGDGLAKRFRISDEAVLYFDQYRNELERSIDPDAVTDGERAYSKRHGSLLRLAGLIHYMHGGSAATEITVATMQAAIELADYFIDHYECFTGSDESPEQEAVRKLLAWAKRRHGEPFSLRQVAQSKCMQPTCMNMDEVREFFAELIAGGLIETDDVDGWHEPKRGSVATKFWVAGSVAADLQPVEKNVEGGFQRSTTFSGLGLHESARGASTASKTYSENVERRTLTEVHLEKQNSIDLQGFSFFEEIDTPPLSTFYVLDENGPEPVDNHVAEINEPEHENSRASAPREYDIDERTGRKVYRKSGLV